MNDKTLGYVLISPTVILLGVLMAYPLLQAILLSFYSINPMTQAGSWVGLQNYADVLTDENFHDAVVANFIWLFGSLAVQVTLGMGFALMLNEKFPGRGIARGLILFPYLMPTVVAVLIWQWMLNDLYGVLSYLWTRAGLPAVDWLGVMPNAMITVIVVGGWKVFPFVVISLLARMQSIPAQLYEAATIDGAGRWSRFRDVTLPQLRNVLFVVVLLRAVWDFKEFDMIFLLTGGGPVNSTTTLPILVYRDAFSLLQMGRASTIAVLMLVIMIVIIAIYLAVSRRLGATEEA